jgi:nicotinate-nucleotide pyrophosphorylase
MINLITLQVLENLIDILMLDSKQRESLYIAIQQVEAMGRVKPQELRQLAMLGLPIISVAAAVLKTNKSINTTITYSDLIVIL